MNNFLIKILITLLFIYSFYANLIIAVFNLSWFKPLISILFLMLFAIDFSLRHRCYKQKKILLAPLLLIVVYILIWPEMGYINLFYTVVFGWILIQHFEFSIKIIKVTFYIQLFLVMYEVLTGSIIYDFVESGIFVTNTFEYISLEKLTIGFRPKGMFSGTLIATSFVIYLSMIFRNNIKMLFLIFFMATLVNGRLALLISGFILLFKLFKKYDYIISYKKASLTKKTFFFLFPFFLFLMTLFAVLPKTNLQNLKNTFNFNTTANASRLYAYDQSISTYLNYDNIQKLIGSPSNEIFDVYDRVVASESGLLSMFLDIGFIGVLFYIYYFRRAWKSEKNLLFGLQSKIISFKFVILLSLLSFFQYEHLNGNVRGTLFWFLILTQIVIDSKKTILEESINHFSKSKKVINK